MIANDRNQLIKSQVCMNDDEFNKLNDLYNLVPEQDIETRGGTYHWVCNYSGGRFFRKVDIEDYIQ